MERITTLITYGKVALGLGFVIFLHELGHFLLAKWNGVKVEKFSIGFGPSLFAFTWGETEYALAILPLGGFVKMLGESPEEANAENRTIDPRAYHNKSISARMAIISAGVIMNLILGIFCFSVVYTQGMLELAAKIGQVVPGSAAYMAGIKVGDEIMAIDGRRDVDFDDLRRSSSLSGNGQKLHLELKRPGQSEPVTVDVSPRRENGSMMPLTGIRPSQSLTLNALPSMPYPWIPLPGMSKEGLPTVDEIKPGDILVGANVDGKLTSAINLQDIDALDGVLDSARDKPIVFKVKRSSREGAKVDTFDLKLPPTHVVDFGFRLGYLPIVAVVPGSPAERAGFQVGDTIVKVGGSTGVDPIRLPSLCRDQAGKPIAFEVSRGGTSVTLDATPDASPIWLGSFLVSESPPENPNEPLDVPGLGIAFGVGREIVAVEDGSPAAKAGLKVGDILNTVTLPALKVPGEKKLETARKPVVVEMNGKSPVTWPTIFKTIQAWPTEGPFEFTVQGKAEKVSMIPEPVATWFYPERGFSLERLFRMLPPQGLLSSLKHGWEDTVDSVMSIFAMFRGLGQGRVSSKGLAGLPRILDMASGAARAGWIPLLQFLGGLSINLAVLNFLPIPPLDGGQMMFLIGEKIRGKPLPQSALTIATLAGLALVLCLLVFTVSQDLLIMTGLIK